LTDDYIDHPYPRARRSGSRRSGRASSARSTTARSRRTSTGVPEGLVTTPQGRGQLFHRFAGESLRTMVRQMGEDQIPVGEALAILHEVLRQDDADRAARSAASRDQAGPRPRPRASGVRERPQVRHAARERADRHGEGPPLDRGEVGARERVRHRRTSWTSSSGSGRRCATRTRERRHGAPRPHRAIDALFVEGTARDRGRLEGHVGGAGRDGRVVRRLLPAAVLRLADLPQLPVGQEVVLREFYVRFSQSREAVVTATTRTRSTRSSRRSRSGSTACGRSSSRSRRSGRRRTSGGRSCRRRASTARSASGRRRARSRCSAAARADHRRRRGRRRSPASSSSARRS
jgi:hypothetical protein